MPGLEARNQAIGMLTAGMTQKYVVTELWVSLRSIERWWRKHRLGESQETKIRPGRNSTVKKAAILMISKSLGKRGKSTKKLPEIVKRGVIQYRVRPFIDIFRIVCSTGG